MYGILKRFWSAVQVPTMRQAGRPSRVFIRGTEILFKPLPLSDRNIRYNRKWDINRIWFVVLRTLDSFKTHYTIPLRNWPVRLRILKWKYFSGGNFGKQGEFHAICQWIPFCFFALQGDLVCIVNEHEKRVDCICGQWQKTVWLVRNAELTRGLTCHSSFTTANTNISTNS